ncbi:8371_t:CDS:2, partial [Funneliformis geosporum]
YTNIMLSCIILGEESAFSVDYNTSKTIGHLKGIIKEQAGLVDLAYKLKLWQVNIHESEKREIYEGINIKEKFEGSSNEVQQVSVSQSEFKLVCENHLLYVDKTSWLHDLFKDLYIYQHPPEIYVKSTVRKWNESDLPPIPVIRLDFSDLTSNEGSEMLRKELIQLLKSIGESYGITLKLDSVKGITKELIITLASHEENMYEKVVILIDEYDSPILNVFNTMKESLKIADENREILKGFFEIIKSSQQKI